MEVGNELINEAQQLQILAMNVKQQRRNAVLEETASMEAEDKQDSATVGAKLTTCTEMLLRG